MAYAARAITESTRMSQKQIPWFDYVSKSKKLLGVAENMSEIRYEKTGHAGVIRKLWLPSIGMWGRIHTAEQIAKAVGLADPQRVRVYANMTGLSYADKSSYVTWRQIDVALRADATSAEEMGIYPIEHRYYRAALAWLRQEGITDFDAMAQAWKTQRLQLSFPSSERQRKHMEKIDAKFFR